MHYNLKHSTSFAAVTAYSESAAVNEIEVISFAEPIVLVSGARPVFFNTWTPRVVDR